MKIITGDYEMILGVIVESASSSGELDNGFEDDFGMYIKIDDIEKDSVGLTRKATFQESLEAANGIAMIFDGEYELSKEDKEKIQAQDSFYKLDNSFFCNPQEILNTGKVFLRKTDFFIKDFVFEGVKYPEIFFEPSFELCYKEDGEFKSFEKC